MEFKYIPLDESKDEIRLLNLHPGENDSPIQCTLENVSLGEYSIHEEGIYKWSGGGVGWAPPKSSETYPLTYVGITTPNDRDEWIPLQWDTIGSRVGSSTANSDSVDNGKVNSNANNLPRFFGKQPDMAGLSVVPDFEALSYTWGTAKATTAIEINGVSFLVTPNLFEALKRLRKGRRHRVLWIDAICVNQGDLAERSRQVRRMPSIYQRAWRVVVWLGDGADGTDRAIECLQSIGGQEKVVKKLSGFQDLGGEWYGPQFDCFSGAEGQSLTELTEKRKLENLRTLNLTTPVEFRDEDWQALGGFLLGCVYWSRAWIIQELTYARSAKLYCGSKSMGWDTFSHITFNEKLRNPRNLDEKYLIARFADLVNESNIALLLDQKASTKQWTRALGFEKEGTSLLQHLVNFRKCKSTDPKDKVYALLGLPSISDDMHFHAPDYTLPTAVVFQETTRSIIKYENCLHALCLQHPEPQPRPYGLPSWCPNWANLTFNSDSRPLINVSVKEQSFKSSGTTIPQAHGDNINSDERINGQDSRLTWAGNHMFLRGKDSFGKKSGFPLSNTYNVTEAQAQDKVLVLDGVHCGEVLVAFEPVPPTAFDNGSQDWKATVLSWESNFASEDLINAHDPDGLPPLADFFWTILKARVRSPPQMEGVNWQRVLFEKYLVWSGRITVEDAKWADLHVHLDSIDDLVRGHVKNWTFGIVGEGTMAMLPSRSQEGDVIAVLFGSDVPFVLRPISDVEKLPDNEDKAGDRYYELIGTAYVHSQLMKGEAMELLEASQKGRTTFKLV